MSEKNRRLLIFLPWLALPLVVGCYAALWSRLPAEIAVQFSLSGEITNSFGRTQTLLLNSAILLFVLGRFTLKLWGASHHATRAVMVTYYVAVVLITTIFLFILKFNLRRA